MTNVSNIDIKETKEVLVAAFKIGDAIKKSLADDGKITFGDSGNLFPVIPFIGPAVEGLNKVPKELGDLSESELVELKTLILDECGELIDNEKLVSQITAGLKWIHATFEFYQTLK